ncbi:MAG: hypothetical protein IJF56_03375 [Clostridia bacterium]|nr:hypothetical protein [Clostridia bacterium]
MKKGAEVGVTSHSAFALATLEFYIEEIYLSTLFWTLQTESKDCTRPAAERERDFVTIPAALL